jgi:hypothetical protein
MEIKLLNFFATDFADLRRLKAYPVILAKARIQFVPHFAVLCGEANGASRSGLRTGFQLSLE